METIAKILLTVMLALSTACSLSVGTQGVGPEPNPGYGTNTSTPPPPEVVLVEDSVPPDGHEPIDEKKGVVTVFFATNRGMISSSGCVNSYGKERKQLVSYGMCYVKIPLDHKTGVIESPSWYKLEWADDPSKHVTIIGGGTVSKADYYKALSSKLKGGGASLIYIHGYNVSFEDAAKRTAQMAYDLHFDGVPAFYSWPSAGSPKSYISDEASVEAAKMSFYNYLVDYLSRPDVKKVYLVAHSMGGRAVSGALVMLSHSVQYSHLRSKLQEIILAAPDIDSEVFSYEIAPTIKKANWPVTMYVSDNDKALNASMKIHNFSRAGFYTSNIVISPGVDTIDASAIKTDFLGHSYYGDSTTLIYDMFNIMNKGERPRQRANLSQVNDGNGIYWRFTP